MNKLFGLAIAVVVVVALLSIFKDQATEIANNLFERFSDSIDDGLIFILPKVF
ncbi:hypothetical protein [Maledivibacter halophilus]|uniref:Uncharacterized protein n=1 Tax=Maledivibacter halophilus TaxID=36842 RepID=A0A1T5LS56_9FIRM|nr:hypothetical protein [Maledivibacter halophilus]SKC78750.1 hypothetical protein SAMN02194393_03206 [Maledivibacter halophilus]